MSESTLSLTRTNLKTYLSDYVAGNSTFSSNTTDTQNRILRAINSGERRFYGAYNWSFLTPLLEVTLTAPYATGTIGVASGVVTLTGGTWPTWAATGLLVTGGASYAVATRDGDAQLTLDDTTLNVTAGASYELKRLQYTLADDFGGFVEPHLSYSSDNDKCQRVRLVGPGRILHQRQAWDQSAPLNQVLEAAVTWLAGPPDATGHRAALMVWPPAEETGIISGPYHSNPNAIGTDSHYPLGGQPFAECLLECCLAAADLSFNDNIGAHEQRYKELLSECVRHEQLRNTPKYLGSMNRSSYAEPGYAGRMSNHYVSYDGSFYLGPS